MASAKQGVGASHPLVDRGDTLVVIEHHPWVIGGADPVIELGPDGGVVVAEGTPKQVSRAKTAPAPIPRELLRTWPRG